MVHNFSTRPQLRTSCTDLSLLSWGPSLAGCQMYPWPLMNPSLEVLLSDRGQELGRSIPHPSWRPVARRAPQSCKDRDRALLGVAVYASPGDPSLQSLPSCIASLLQHDPHDRLLHELLAAHVYFNICFGVKAQIRPLQNVFLTHGELASSVQMCW